VGIGSALIWHWAKKNQQDKAGQWNAILAKCDLQMARDQIADMHRMLNAQVKESGALYFKNEYVFAWEAFRDKPTIDNARVLLDIAPQLLRYLRCALPAAASIRPTAF